MKQKTFFELLKYIETYCTEYERITYFELAELLGSKAYLLFLIILTMPLFVFSTQTIVLPITALGIMSAIWYSFDQPIWLPDCVKRRSIDSKRLKTIAARTSITIEQWQKTAGDESSYWSVCKPLNVALIIVSLFLIGFVPLTSFWPLFSLLFMTVALLLRDSILSLLGYFTLFVALL